MADDDHNAAPSDLDWPRIFSDPAWTLHETACYFSWQIPATTGRPDAESQVLPESADPTARRVYRLLKDMAITGDPRIIRMGGWFGDDRIKPVDAMNWAVQRTDFKVPEPIIQQLAHLREAPAQRHARLRRRVEEEKQKGNPAFNKTVAKEEGISVARLKQILDKQD